MPKTAITTTTKAAANMQQIYKNSKYLLIILIILTIDINLISANNNNNNTNSNNINNQTTTIITNENKTVLQAQEQQNEAAAGSAPTTTTISHAAATKATTTTTNTHNRTLITPTRVRLNKCCPMHEYLDDKQQKCIAGSTELWVPLIFLIIQGRYHQPLGTSSKYISFLPNMRPIRQQQQQHLSESNTTTTAATPPSTSICNTNADLTLFSSTSNSKLVLFSNGSLYLTKHGLLIEPNNYCVDRDVALVCLPEQQRQQFNTQLQIMKCCGKYGNYDAKNQNCTFNVQNQKKNINLQNNGKLLLKPLNESIYQTIYGFPECTDGSSSYAVAGDWKEAQLNISNGHIQLPHKKLSAKDYCLEHLHTTPQQDNTAGVVTDTDADDAATAAPVKIIVCSHHFAQNDADKNQIFLDGILHTCIIISVIFLAATLIASYMLPSVHHALHWRCQIYYVFCLFIGELLLSSSNAFVERDSFVCLLVASGIQFFMLSAFFWLNTMCFNIWWTFRDFRPSSLERNQELLRLRLYSAYAWGIPLLISVIAICVDQLPDAQLLHPGFGEKRCWFNDERLSIFAYFFGPIALLLCTNIMLFMSTTHQLTCGLWKRDDVKSTTEKTALGKVCLKLVVVMGVTWIAEVISWLVGGQQSNWFIFDLINALQGVFIFIVVGCQPQVWAACKRICCPRLRHDITNTTNGVQHSSSSQGLPSLGTGNCTEFTQNSSITASTICNGGAINDGVDGGGIYVCSTTGANAQISNNTNTTTNVNVADNTNATNAATAAAKVAAAATAANTQSKIPMETVC